MSDTDQGGHPSILLFEIEFQGGQKIPAAHISLEVAIESARQAETDWGWRAVRIKRGTEVILQGQELRTKIDKA